jgi:hypothetical protein
MFVMALKRGVHVTMFLEALKRAIPRSWYAAEFSPGVDAVKTAACLSTSGRVVSALSKSDVLGSSFPSVVGRVHAGSRCVSTLGVGGARRLAGTPVLDAGRSSLTPRASCVAGSTDCLALRMPVFNTLPLSPALANAG